MTETLTVLAVLIFAKFYVVLSRRLAREAYAPYYRFAYKGIK